ncbi:MAG: lactoylglutathione lyase [Bacteroidota bacterium]|nr:lactoylglutathione lyase [Bacteroidota bacterium]
MNSIQFILYVANQNKSRDFYKTILQLEPILDVPGMCEFQLNDLCKLGLMPETGIVKILGNKIPYPQTGNGIPRCELYLKTGDVSAAYQRALSAGAKSISEPAYRDWGDEVAYVADKDGHVVAFVK